MKLTGPWDRDRVDEFLEEARIPVRVGCRTPADDPWIVSLWFAWDGAVHCATGAHADIVDFLEHDARVSFDVSTNDPPYRGVRGRGTATISPDEEKTQLRALFEKYLDGTDNGLGRRLLRPEREEVHVRIDPDRIHTWDFTGRMPASSRTK